MLGALVFLAACAQQSAQQPAVPPPPPKPLLEYLGEWGTRGDGPGQLRHPGKMAVDFAANVYIVDVGSGYIHKFSPEGRPLLSFQDAALQAPSGIAVDRGGAIYVADPARGRVAIFYPDGARLRQIRCAPSRRSGEPLAVVVDDDGTVFVADAARGRIQKFNARGRLLGAWGSPGAKPGAWPSPSAIAVGSDGFLYVADGAGPRVVKLTRDGEVVATLGPWTVPSGPMAIAGLAVSRKHVFVVDPKARSIRVVTLDGQYAHTEDLASRFRAAEPTPYDVAVSPRGELLVLDPLGCRVLRFRINF